LVVVDRAGQVAAKLIEAVMDRIVLRLAAEVPLAEERGGVAMILHHARNGELARIEAGRIEVACDDIDNAHALLVAAGHERGPRGTAHGTVGMEIDEGKAFTRHTVEYRRLHPAAVRPRRDVGIAQI